MFPHCIIISAVGLWECLGNNFIQDDTLKKTQDTRNDLKLTRKLEVWWPYSVGERDNVLEVRPQRSLGTITWSSVQRGAAKGVSKGPCFPCVLYSQRSSSVSACVSVSVVKALGSEIFSHRINEFAGVPAIASVALEACYFSDWSCVYWEPKRKETWLTM